MPKMKIKVHESEETLLDSFEQLSYLIHLTSSRYSDRSSNFSMWSDILKIQNGETPSDTPEDVKQSIERARTKINSAFENFITKLDAYL